MSTPIFCYPFIKSLFTVLFHWIMTRQLMMVEFKLILSHWLLSNMPQTGFNPGAYGGYQQRVVFILGLSMSGGGGSTFLHV